MITPTTETPFQAGMRAAESYLIAWAATAAYTGYVGGRAMYRATGGDLQAAVSHGWATAKFSMHIFNWAAASLMTVLPFIGFLLGGAEGDTTGWTLLFLCLSVLSVWRLVYWIREGTRFQKAAFALVLPTAPWPPNVAVDTTATEA